MLMGLAVVPEDLSAAVSTVEFRTEAVGLAGGYKALAQWQESREDVATPGEQGTALKSPFFKCQVGP